MPDATAPNGTAHALAAKVAGRLAPETAATQEAIVVARAMEAGHRLADIQIVRVEIKELGGGDGDGGEEAGLRALAEAATPGPWAQKVHSKPGPGSDWTVSAEDGARIIGEGWWGSEKDGAFIAASHPGAILGLLAKLERLRGGLGWILENVDQAKAPLLVGHVRNLLGRRGDAG